MKVIVADTYIFNIYNSKNVKFPKQYKNHRILWDMREALLAIWEGKLTELAIPEEGTPGYDFPWFINEMVKQKQIESAPKLKYYSMSIVQKN